MIKWYVLQVNTGEEIAVRNRLIQMGYITCVPQEERPIRKGGEWSYRVYVLFSGYIFIECNFDAKSYYEIKSTPSVIKWLGASPVSPSPLSYMEAEWIRALSYNGLPLAPSKVKINEDGNIEVVDGILNSVTHCIKKVDKHARKVTVELTIAGEKQTTQLAIEIIE